MTGEIGIGVSIDMANIFAVGIGEEASDEVSNTNRNNLAVAKPEISVNLSVCRTGRARI